MHLEGASIILPDRCWPQRHRFSVRP